MVLEDVNRLGRLVRRGVDRYDEITAIEGRLETIEYPVLIPERAEEPLDRRFGSFLSCRVEVIPALSPAQHLEVVAGGREPVHRVGHGRCFVEDGYDGVVEIVDLSQEFLLVGEWGAYPACLVSKPFRSCV
jgi:hypothetical protein